MFVARYWPDVNPSDFRASVKLSADLPPFHIPPLQSPINIRTSRTTLRRLPPLKFRDLLSPDVLVDMRNTGSTGETKTNLFWAKGLPIFFLPLFKVIVPKIEAYVKCN